MKGTYRYSYAKHYTEIAARNFTRFTLRVDILAQTAKRYYVSFLDYHADGRPPGSCSWVGRDKVKLDEERPTCTYVPKLPYKD